MSSARMPDDRCDLLCLDLPRAEALRAGRLGEDAARAFAERARALADPTRLVLAAALAESAEELCVCDLAWVAEPPGNLVSHHLRTLRSAGVVRSRREGKMVMYELTVAGLSLLAAVREGAEVAP